MNTPANPPPPDATPASPPTIGKARTSTSARNGAGVWLWALVRQAGSKVADLAVLVVYLVCASCRRRQELYAEAEQIAKELHARLAPLVAASSFRRTAPDPVTKQRILEQILATPTPRTRENGLTTWPRRRRRWTLTILAMAVAVAVAAAAVLAATASDRSFRPAPSHPSRADQPQPERTLPGQRTGTPDPAHTPRPAGAGTLPACPTPPPGVRAPTEVLLHLPDLPPIPIRPVYRHQDDEGVHVWHVYGPAGLATVAHVRTSGVLPPLTTVELQADRLPDGRHRFRPLPCQPAPDAAPASAGGARTKDSSR
jgi:hypothetical protein